MNVKNLPEIKRYDYKVEAISWRSASGLVWDLYVPAPVVFGKEDEELFVDFHPDPEAAREQMIAGIERLKSMFAAECDSAIEAVKKAEVRT